MIGDPTQIREPAGQNPEELSRLLEIELIQKRSQWQQASARNKNLKTYSLLFLFLVVFAGLGGFFYLFLHREQDRSHQPPTNVLAKP